MTTVWEQPVLITGGGGFLGRYIVEALLARGVAVRIYQRSDHPDLAARGVAVHRGDLTDQSRLTAAMQGCGAVIHTAAKAGVWGPRTDFFRANVEGTRAVIEVTRACGVKRIVYTSTPSVVFSGEPFEGADETLPYGRNWLCHYAETKAIAEQEILAAHQDDGLRVCALRPHLIWGVGDPHLLPRVLARARAGRLAQVGDGSNRVDITHVRNAAAAHIQALEALEAGRAGGKAYFISQGEPVQLWPWIADVLSRAGAPPIRRRISARAAYAIGAVAETIWRGLRLRGEPPMTRFVSVELAKSHWFSIEAARRDLGYTPEAFPSEPALQEYISSL